MSNSYNTRIENIDRIRTAYIMWEDIPIATITEEYSSLSENSDWVIRPIWENYDKARERGHIVDIAGIDEDLHLAEYIRTFTPLFVTQRTIPYGREDCPEELARLQMDAYDYFEMMCRSHAVTGNDRYYVSRTPDKIINVQEQHFPYDIPNWDTSSYGWLSNKK